LEWYQSRTLLLIGCLLTYKTIERTLRNCGKTFSPR
jgi:hypothetical protein